MRAETTSKSLTVKNDARGVMHDTSTLNMSEVAVDVEHQSMQTGINGMEGDMNGGSVCDSNTLGTEGEDTGMKGGDNHGACTPNKIGNWAIKMPHDAVTAFLEKAKHNSQANREMLGLLAGNQDEGKLSITHLIIPLQQGDAASCECLGEVQVARTFQDLGVIQIGWIHTHPAHDTFLSSVDVHTQYALQRMVPGAVATVCSIGADCWIHTHEVDTPHGYTHIPHMIHSSVLLMSIPNMHFSEWCREQWQQSAPSKRRKLNTTT